MTIEEPEKKISDEELDKFQPSRFDFFVIGNEKDCVPCRNVMRDIEVYKDISENEITTKKWDYDIKTSKIISSIASFGEMCNAWLDRERSRNAKLRDWKTIPMVWHDGKFIGGSREHQRALAEKF